MAQYGFFFDQSRCLGCNTCAVACKDWNNIPPGPVKLARVFKWEKGAFPGVRVHTLFAPCYHCANPVCVDVANGAMYKEAKYGAVLIDPDKAADSALKAAAAACPYGAIVFDSDAPGSKAYKCNMCVDKLTNGEKPVCVMACYMRALDFDTMENLQKNYGTLRDLEDMPSSAAVQPSVVFKAHDSKTKLVDYPEDKAFQLLAKRDPLPSVFSSSQDVTNIPDGLVGRPKLVMKAASTDQLMQETTFESD